MKFKILYIWYREMMEVLHDKGILIFIVFVPLAYPLLYSYVYTNEVVREIPAAVVNESRSQLARGMVRDIDACPEVDVVAKCANMAEARLLMEQGKVYGIIHIPRSFAKDISKGEQTRIGLYCDMSSMLYYKGLLLAVNNVSLEMNRNIKVERYLHTTTDREEEVAKMPIDYEYVPLFNPQSGFAAFLIPPVLMLIIQQTIFLGVGMSMGRNRENYPRYKTLLARCSPIHIVLGKTLFYFMLYVIMAVYMFTAVTRLFCLPSLGDMFTLLALVVPYLLACIFMAIVLSVLVYRREDCILLFVFLSVPLLFLSGISWPEPSMPQFWRYVSWLFPSTFGMNGYVRVMGCGATLSDIAVEFRGLWIQAAVYLVLSCLMYRWRIRKLKMVLQK